MKVIIVDDDESFGLHLSKALTRRGYHTLAVSNGNEAITRVRNELFDAAVIDMNMIDMDGLQVLQGLKEIHPKLIGVILTGHGSISNAVEATKLGAYDYLSKPCDISKLETVLTNGYHGAIKAMEPFTEIYHGIVGQSPGIKKIVRIINQVKDSHLPALICGESGVGKELVARALHYDSKRSKYPFVAINCASLKTDLLENEFFGHVKGAFTGATDIKDGIVKIADKGTFFIDEITDMNPQIQASLLRFIEIGTFRPMGSPKECKVDVRIIAAVNRNIEKEVEEKKFRNDLYYRLNVCRIDIPPLRERKEDIPLLLDYFLASKISAYNSKITISSDAQKLLMSHSWMGNVRELFHIMERAILTLEDNLTITADIIKLILPTEKTLSPKSLSGISLDSVERISILDNLKANNWNVSRTAQILGIDRRTLQRKIKRYNIR
tara:strand:- start:243 stop:1556 length:1314 start_codon:yes stop_codon:yes gene_type:complete